jgi:hypothetical protein
MASGTTISGPKLRARIDKLGLTYTEAAKRLGLTMDGLHKQMRGDRPVSRQTEIILSMLESLPSLNQAGRRQAQRQMEDLRDEQPCNDKRGD